MANPLLDPKELDLNIGRDILGEKVDVGKIYRPTIRDNKWLYSAYKTPWANKVYEENKVNTTKWTEYNAI